MSSGASAAAHCAPHVIQALSLCTWQCVFLVHECVQTTQPQREMGRQRVPRTGRARVRTTEWREQDMGRRGSRSQGGVQRTTPTAKAMAPSETFYASWPTWSQQSWALAPALACDVTNAHHPLASVLKAESTTARAPVGVVAHRHGRADKALQQSKSTKF
jgi:hypothetical protein